MRGSSTGSAGSPECVDGGVGVASSVAIAAAAGAAGDKCPSSLAMRSCGAHTRTAWGALV